MSPEKKRFTVYLAALAATTVVVVVALLALNYSIDPYFIHQWDSPLLERQSPAQQKIMPWAKTYAAYRYQPEVVLLGSSRSEIGLPTDSRLFTGKKVFNLAISGASVGDARKMLAHTSFFHHPEIVVWGLDYGWQFREKTGNTDLVDGLIAHDDFYPQKRFFLNIKRVLSMAMTIDTIKILTGQSEKSCKSLLAYNGHKSAECLEIIMQNEGGTRKAFEEVLKKKEPYGNPPEIPVTLRQLGAVTDDLCERGATIRFFIQPLHALAELAYWATLENDLDDWKRGLTAMTSERKQQGCDIELYDFSGFNSITTEAIPQATGRDEMKFYYEQSHYRSEVGEKIIETMLGAGTKPIADFGISLKPENIENHLHNYRITRQQYIDSHPQETRNIIQ